MEQQATLGQKFERFLYNSGVFVGLISWGILLIMIIANMADDGDVRSAPTDQLIEVRADF